MKQKISHKSRWKFKIMPLSLNKENREHKTQEIKYLLAMAVELSVCCGHCTVVNMISAFVHTGTVNVFMDGCTPSSSVHSVEVESIAVSAVKLHSNKHCTNQFCWRIGNY